VKEFKVDTKADFIAEFLALRHVSAVFQLSGGMTAFLADSIARLGKTPIVNARHEQSAGFAAECATRFSGVPSVALATSGPGASNLISAIASSYFDSVPTIFITGQVNQSEFKKSALQRQNGFQELDIAEMVRGITKLAVRVSTDSNLSQEFERAWETAMSGRPGPVLIDIPIDVQQEKYLRCGEELSSIHPSSHGNLLDEGVKTLGKWLGESTRPLFLLGGGIRISNSVELVRELVQQWKVPSVHSLMAVDILEESNPFRVGMIGSYGNRWANRALAKSDLVVVLGSRLDIRQTGSDVASFRKNKRIFRVDIDSHELNGRVVADYSVEGDLRSILGKFLQMDYSNADNGWIESIRKDAELHPQASEQSSLSGINPTELMSWISELGQHSNGYIVDVGQHQMWAAQSIKVAAQQRFMTSGGLGAMGFAIPGAIGAAIQKPGRWIAITGDGCAQLSISELQTIQHYNLPITICVINNNQHGMVAQFQEHNTSKRFIGTREGYSAPNFSQVAAAFGIESRRLDTISNPKESPDLLSKHPGPLLLEFMVSNEAKALPKMSSGVTIHDL
jgi:acetolactate synthase-1/2/3 large subunit